MDVDILADLYIYAEDDNVERCGKSTVRSVNDEGECCSQNWS